MLEDTLGPLHVRTLRLISSPIERTNRSIRFRSVVLFSRVELEDGDRRFGRLGVTESDRQWNTIKLIARWRACAWLRRQENSRFVRSM